jgi:RAMP superfamily
MTVTVSWSGTITARSSIAHGGETRGTITLLRRELIVQPDGRAVPVPVISGNSVRGVLRRTGELLLRDVLDYEGQLPLAAAHALRGGGSLARVSGEPLSGSRLRRLRALVPQIGVFGCAAGGRIIDGCLQVGKLWPHVAECAHLPGIPPAPPPSAELVQLETYTRRDETDYHDFAAAAASQDGLQEDPDSLLMTYRIETFPVGTRFAAWFRLTRASALEAAFFTDLLAAWTVSGRIGGRTATGHGVFAADLAVTPALPDPLPDWRSELAAARAEALEAIASLT